MFQGIEGKLHSMVWNGGIDTCSLEVSCVRENVYHSWQSVHFNWNSFSLTGSLFYFQDLSFIFILEFRIGNHLTDVSDGGENSFEY